jgi:hypothetical protein
MFALKSAKKAFGTTAFTEHHEAYMRVGYRKGNRIISAIGDTWEDALNALVLKSKEV